MVVLRRAQVGERITALQRLFQHMPPDEVLSRVRTTLPLIGEQSPEAAQLAVAADNDRIVGAILYQSLIGATGIVWPPQVATDIPDAGGLALQMVRHAVAQLHGAGAKVVQAIIGSEDSALGEPLLRFGFQQPIAIWYLRHDLELTPQLLCSPDRVGFCDYRHCPSELFHSVLLRSYEDTLDFPEVGGRRSVEEIIDGLKAGGFQPDQWWLAQGWSGGVGVLVLSQPDVDSWEISYVGVVPEARRRGIGRELVRKALFEAKAGGAHELVLSVDARNSPALSLYRRLGFEVHDRRSVYLLTD